MAKQYFLIVDTETTQDGQVADLGMVVCDRKGMIHHQAGILVHGVFDNEQEHPLFFTQDANPLWGRRGLPARYARYNAMLNSGSRMLASVNAVNRWLERARGQYNPTLTAYNLAFDTDKCGNTGIDLSIFSDRFCLWHAAAAKWGSTKNYRQFVLENVAFNKPTDKGNMSFQTNAEVMARFVTNNPELPDEPHTALEDAIYYELPILHKLVNTVPRKEYMDPPGYNWKDYQVNQHFKPA